MENHALVIGGTGMLKGVVAWLHNQGFFLSVVGRSKHKFEKMLQELGLDHSNISFLEQDYYEIEAFKRKVLHTVELNGAITLCITWMRSDAETSFDWIRTFLMNRENPVELYEIKGSQASKITFLPVIHNAFSWKRIILGFKIENENSRWLTNKEISDGVIESIKDKHDLHMVGVVEPWEKRP